MLLLMKPLLVHVHLFYPEVWPELCRCVQNVAPLPMELYVTMTAPHPELEAEVRHCFPDAHVLLVENRGYDIAPFLHVLGQVNLDDYSYVVKLHSKREEKLSDFRRMRGSAWRDYLLSFLSSRERFSRVLAAFEKHEHLGMHADYHVVVRRDLWDGVSMGKVKAWLASHQLPQQPFSFVAGTMFVARAALMKQIICYPWSADEFSDAHEHVSSHAHVYERLLGYFICHQGYEVRDALACGAPVALIQLRDWWQYVWRIIGPFFYHVRYTSSGRKIIRVLRVPVYFGRKGKKAC